MLMPVPAPVRSVETHQTRLILVSPGASEPIAKIRENFPTSVGAARRRAAKVKNPQISASYLFDR